LERGRSLGGENGILSVDELDRLSLAVDTGLAAVGEAEAAVRVQEERLGDLVIRAPFRGVITARLVELGSWISTGDPVARVVDRQRLKARGSVSQEERVRLHPGAAVLLRTDALPGAVFTGRLRYLGHEAETATGTYLVEAEVAVEPDDAEPVGAEPVGRAGEMGDRLGSLLPGMSAEMVLELASHRDLLLPRTALVETSSGPAVFVVEGEIARRRPVEAEEIGPGRVRVIRGLEAGNRVVVQGQHRLADGQVVEVRESGTGPKAAAGSEGGVMP
ncbi:MAG: HlyD family efflux transporter periplasmic adaptor subunit, partial [Holophagales bacterium]|nr:HlyD family efflux transporter periplasmic adaptor subunit [Holophagales bacterium]